MLLTLLSVASLLPPAPQLAGIWSSPLGERAPLRAVCCTVAGSGEDVSMADENRPLAQIEIHADAASADAASLPDFVALGVSVPGVVENLAAQKIIRPNALQRAAFAEIAAGRDAILHAWTGSGKTLAFLLPLLERLDPKERSPQLLIICPSRELAFQIARVAEMVLAGSGMSAAAVVGGANPNRQLEKIKKERPSVIVGTPGRVCELAFDWQKLKLQRIRHVVIDEVDAALKPPHLDHCQQLLHSTQDGRPLQLVLASATADTPPVRRVAAQLLKSPLMLRLRPPASSADGGTGDDANDDAGDEDGGGNAEGALSALGAQLPSSITHGLMVISPNKGLKQVHALHHTTPSPKCLVFVNSPYRVKMVCERLESQYNLQAVPLYGEQEREERVDVMRKLLDGTARLAVSTEMGARGLDIPGLSHVVNLELPTDPSHYVHRAGRCGRAGTPGTVVSLCPPGKAFVVSKLTKALGVPLVDLHIKGGKVEPGRAVESGGGSGSRRAQVRPSRATTPTGGGGGGGERMRSAAAAMEGEEEGGGSDGSGSGSGSSGDVRRAPRSVVKRTKSKKKGAAAAPKAKKPPRPPKVKRGYPKQQPTTMASGGGSVG